MTLSSRHPPETREVQVPCPRVRLFWLSHHPEQLEDARREGGHDPELGGPSVH